MNTIDILAPDLPESVVDGVVVVLHKNIGETINRDEVFIEIETDKIILEVPSPEFGIIKSLLVKKGDVVISKQILGSIYLKDKFINKSINSNINNTLNVNDKNNVKLNTFNKDDITLSPSYRHSILKNNFSIKDFDMNNHTDYKNIENYFSKNNINKPLFNNFKNITSNKRTNKRIPISNLRKRLSDRLLESKNNTIMLTTFNEVNMKLIINLRKKYNELFEKIHNVRLGFMSFYVKSVLEALKYFPEINSCIDNNEIIYYDYLDISIAVSTSRGLVTPVLRNVNIMTIADIEKNIKELVSKAQNNKLTVDDLSGGNFTITNGGIFGSLMSTPIINPPQSAILGMHVIKDRPVSVNNEVVVLPMMYLALTYDHRIIDGKESVGFLLKIKEIIEDPIRLLLNI